MSKKSSLSKKKSNFREKSDFAKKLEKDKKKKTFEEWHPSKNRMKGHSWPIGTIFGLDQDHMYELKENNRWHKCKPTKKKKHEIVDLYEKLKSVNLNTKSIKFINMPTTNGEIRTHSYKPPGINIEWDDIKCTKIKTIDGVLTLKTSCCSDTPEGKEKVFVREYKNLYEYAKAIQDDKVTKKTHDKLWKFITSKAKKLKMTPINHNKELNILHFKFKT